MTGALKFVAGRVAFWAWALLVSLIVATLVAAHWIALPVPDRDAPELAAALATTLEDGENDRWLAVHVLYTDCPCSVRVIEHLLESERPAYSVDKLILVGDPYDYAEAARDRGLWVATITPQTLRERYQIESAPLFAVVSPQSLGGRVEYIGGYTARKRGPDIQDLEILARLSGNRGVTEHPVYGCGVSKELQTLLDPLGVKY